MMKRKAQAIAEMGIMAMVILMALGTVATYVAKMNSDQFQLMEAFRRALKKSHDENKSIAYGTWDDRRGVDVYQPIIGNKIQSSGAGYVLWTVNSVVANGETGEDPETELYVSINSLPGMTGYNEYKSEKGGSIAPEYLSVSNETVTASTAGSATSSVRAGGVGEFMSYEIGGSMTVFQGRGYGGARPLGGSN